jgi:hypothetical protein
MRRREEHFRPLARFPAVPRDSPVDPMRLSAVRLPEVLADVRLVAHQPGFGGPPVDAATRLARSSLPELKKTSVKIMLANAELDPGADPAR